MRLFMSGYWIRTPAPRSARNALNLSVLATSPMKRKIYAKALSTCLKNRLRDGLGKDCHNLIVGQKCGSPSDGLVWHLWDGSACSTISKYMNFRPPLTFTNLIKYSCSSCLSWGNLLLLMEQPRITFSAAASLRKLSVPPSWMCMTGFSLALLSPFLPLPVVFLFMWSTSHFFQLAKLTLYAALFFGYHSSQIRGIYQCTQHKCSKNQY